MRLPAYRNQLLTLSAAGEAVVSSRDLASRLSISDAQLRRDLSYLALLGRPGRGYQVDSLLEVITQVLGLDQRWRLAVVGVGSLGTALARYPGFAASQMELAALFDADPALIGKTLGQVVVESVERIGEVVAERQVDIAVITVPASEAQDVADRLVAAGVKALLNFSVATLQVPEGVLVRNVDITSELQQLTYSILHGSR